ncbi:MAG: hypothetical protein ACWIPH_05925 [Ostreibacterium sp.]
MSKGIIEKGQLIMLEIVGKATLDDNEYDVFSSIKKEMVVECKKTGKKFIITWAACINMAIQAGISEEPNETQ